MRESDMHSLLFDAGREAGRLEEAKKLLLELALDRFGEPEEMYLTLLNSFTDLRYVELLIKEMHKVGTGWSGLFARAGYAFTIEGHVIRMRDPFAN